MRVFSPAEPEASPVVAEPVDAPAEAQVRRDVPPPPPTEADAWGVQVVSLEDRSRAHEAQVGLAERGFPAYVLTSPSPEGTWYRVRVGPFGDRASAEAIAATLDSLGYSTWIVADP